MIISISLILASIGLIGYRIWQIERIQSEILLVYAHLEISSIQLVHQRCCHQMDLMMDGSLLTKIDFHGQSEAEAEPEDPPLDMAHEEVKDVTSQMSEEEREQIHAKQYLARKHRRIRSD
jgi:predicted negative regulator of RcsB-dependent stress response